MSNAFSDLEFSRLESWPRDVSIRILQSLSLNLETQSLNLGDLELYMMVR